MNLKEVGHTIQIAGVIYNSDQKEHTYILLLPKEQIYRNHDEIHMELDDWEKFFWQTDILEMELNDTQKTIVRKAERQIAGRISWKVYARDEYTCRYCGKTGIPLTVDHVILWEEGGPSIPENLVTSCRKCNRTRGDTPYAEWIESKVYLNGQEKFSNHIKNVDLIDTLDNIPRSFTKMRGKKR
jgi:hypothetical protein